jgi:hypothetical protein
MQPRRITPYLIVGAVALFLATGQRAAADGTLNLQFAGTTSVPGLQVSLNGVMNAKVEPGPYFWNVNPPPTGGGSPISTFCMELSQGVLTSGSAPYNIVSLTDPSTTISMNNGSKAGAVANAIEALYGFYYNTAWGTLNSFQNSSTSVQNQAAAFQLAAWELIYDGTNDLIHPNATNFFTTGNFTAQSCSAESQAQTMLNNVLNNINQGITDFDQNLPGTTVVALTNPGYQDQLWLQPTPKVSPAVPAPPGILLAGFGFVALVGRARWNRRRPAPV